MLNGLMGNDYCIANIIEALRAAGRYRSCCSHATGTMRPAIVQEGRHHVKASCEQLRQGERIRSRRAAGGACDGHLARPCRPKRGCRKVRRVFILAALLMLVCATGGLGQPSGEGGAGDSAASEGSVRADSGGAEMIRSNAGIVRTVSSVTHQGITWTFSQPAQVGQYVTGDYYVVAPVTIAAISPPPKPGRNGSVINLPNVQDRTGFDDRMQGNRFDATLRSNPPFTLRPGDSLVSSISVATPGRVENWLREGSGEKSRSPVKTVSILTCVSTPPPPDAFRPSYGNTSGRIYRLGQVNRALLPRLQPPGAVDDALLNTLSERFSRPWVDNLFFSFDAQVDYMAMYGREVGRATGLAGLLLLLDLPPALQPAQERLLIGFLQRGIDLWGLVRAGHPGWQAHGGHGSGRKWPIIFAGMLFDDAAMRAPNASYPTVRFGEDMQTALYAGPPYGPAWVGGSAIYTGHTGLWNGTPVSTDPEWGPYEHLPPAQWPGSLGESYRRCCTSIAWVGQALAARLMNAQAYWGHDAFFAYVDRWMDGSGDAAYTQAIFEQRGLDYRAGWLAQGQAWDHFVSMMWQRYR